MKTDPLSRYLQTLSEKAHPFIGACPCKRAKVKGVDYYFYLPPKAQGDAKALSAALTDAFQTAACRGRYLNITLTPQGLYALLQKAARAVVLPEGALSLPLPHDHPLFLPHGYAAMILQKKEPLGGNFPEGPYVPDMILEVLSLATLPLAKLAQRVMTCYRRMAPYWYLDPRDRALWQPVGRLLAQALFRLGF